LLEMPSTAKYSHVHTKNDQPPCEPSKKNVAFGLDAARLENVQPAERRHFN